MNQLFDIVTCLGPNDVDVIHKSITYTKRNVIGYRNIYIISYDPTLKIDGAIIIDENIFPFNKQMLETMYGKRPRIGWYLQQLLKLYAGNIIPGILDKYLVLDSDVFFLKPHRFLTDDNKPIFATGYEYHMPYFVHMNKLHNTLRKTHPRSGICHHSMFITKYINQMMQLVEANFDNKSSFWLLCMQAIDPNEFDMSGFSEYEMYFTFMNLYYPDDFVVRDLKWKNTSHITQHDLYLYDFLGINYYDRTNINSIPALQ